jgi:uncharacterized protein (TIGR02118 family)
MKGSPMIKVSVMYPYSPSTKFNHDYYRDTHMPLVKRLMGNHLLRYTVDKGIPDDKNAPPTYAAIGHLYCASMEAFQAGFGPHSEQILDDVPNYTDIKFIIQFNEIRVE